jgi:hypothetical protein
MRGGFTADELFNYDCVRNLIPARPAQSRKAAGIIDIFLIRVTRKEHVTGWKSFLQNLI